MGHGSASTPKCNLLFFLGTRFLWFVTIWHHNNNHSGGWLNLRSMVHLGDLQFMKKKKQSNNYLGDIFRRLFCKHIIAGKVKHHCKSTMQKFNKLGYKSMLFLLLPLCCFLINTGITIHMHHQPSPCQMKDITAMYICPFYKEIVQFLIYPWTLCYRQNHASSKIWSIFTVYMAEYRILTNQHKLTTCFKCRNICSPASIYKYLRGWNKGLRMEQQCDRAVMS